MTFKIHPKLRERWSRVTLPSIMKSCLVAVATIITTAIGVGGVLATLYPDEMRKILRNGYGEVVSYFGGHAEILNRSPGRLESNSMRSSNGCGWMEAEKIRVVVIPDKINLRKEHVPDLQKALGCQDFFVVFGRSSAFPGTDVNAIFYNQPIAYRKIVDILVSLRAMNVRVKYVCSNVIEVPNGSVWLAYFNEADYRARPLPEAEMSRVIKARDQVEFESLLRNNCLSR